MTAHIHVGVSVCPQHVRRQCDIRVVSVNYTIEQRYTVRLFGAEPDLAEAFGIILGCLPALRQTWDNTGDASEVAWRWARWFGVAALYDYDWEIGVGE